MPRQDRFGVVFIDLVIESSGRSPPLHSLVQASADRAVADAVGNVDHVLKPHVGRERIDEDEIELVDLDGVPKRRGKSPSLAVTERLIGEAGYSLKLDVTVDFTQVTFNGHDICWVPGRL